MPRAVRDFSPIYSTEQVILSFDFSAALAPAETLVNGTATVPIILVVGTDATPSLRLIGGPAIIGSFVAQMVGLLQPGATYDIIATVMTSASQTLTTNAHQSCRGNSVKI